MDLKDPGEIIFEGVIKTEISSSTDSAWVDFPRDLKATFGKGNLVPVEAVFDGRVTYHGSLAMMGGRQAMLILRKDIRDQLGKQPGDTVKVSVKLDTRERRITLAPDEKKILEKTKLLEAFEKLAYSHQKEFHQWIMEAKRPETRLRRLEQMCQMLEKKQTRN